MAPDKIADNIIQRVEGLIFALANPSADEKYLKETRQRLKTAIMQALPEMTETQSSTAERERCAKIAETVPVKANGHPQIDAPTIGDARRVIAAAIRKSV